jgi:hypothetical protein
VSQAGIGQLAAHNGGGDPWLPFPGHDRAAGSVALSCGARDKQWSLPQTQIEMATGTRNPSTRRVLPDKEAGMG